MQSVRACNRHAADKALSSFDNIHSTRRQQMSAFQDFYPENVAHCYGCGRLNEHGHQIKTHWDGDETVTRFTPRPEHTAIPGFVYGGLLASLIDCHGTGSAAAAMYRAENRPMDSEPPFRFVTASLHVDYLKPTPLGPELEIRGRIKEIRGRKVIVEATVYAEGVATARGEIVAAQMPPSFAA
jgi:acyl-coenzyme A thioesterase PaaI-like protein